MKRLYRSRRDRMLGGVCAGLAGYLGIDPTVVRLLVVVVFIMTGCFPTLFAYIVAWAIVPEAPAASGEAGPPEAPEG